MPKHAYLRTDGRYDTYDVEPKIISAAEYANLKKCEELHARREQALVSRTKLDLEIADLDKQLAALTPTSAEPAEPVSVATSNTDTSGKRRW